MSLTSKFIQSLIALTASIPATAATTTTPQEPAPAVSAGAATSIDFASNLSTKLAGMQPVEPTKFGQCWPRTDFTEVQRAVASGPVASTMSPAEAFRRATGRA